MAWPPTINAGGPGERTVFFLSPRFFFRQRLNGKSGIGISLVSAPGGPDSPNSRCEVCDLKGGRAPPSRIFISFVWRNFLGPPCRVVAGRSTVFFSFGSWPPGPRPGRIFPGFLFFFPRVFFGVSPRFRGGFFGFGPAVFFFDLPCLPLPLLLSVV